MIALSSTPILAFSALIFAAASLAAESPTCRYLPTDAEWPPADQWDELNSTVDGRLVATVPLAAVCHGAEYDATQCDVVRGRWTSTLFHEESPSSIMAPYYQNQSCDPFTPSSKACELGNYASYSIDVSSAMDVAAGLKFAAEKNVRIAIKNTGHDYLGRSTGTGALSFWTHNLRSREFIPNYNSPAYTGPALKLGAGNRAYEAIEFADANGVRIVTGSCPTIGIVGGFLLGGGSGPLSSKYGVAADQALAYEVVVADGKLLVATPTDNTDLYWALSGGGGGTYGVVLSVTIRAFPDGIVSGASLNFSRENVSNDTTYDMLGHMFDLAPALTAAGMQVGWLVTKTSFSINPLTAPGIGDAELSSALAPFTTKLDEAGIVYDLKVTTFSNYREHYNTYMGTPYPEGPYGIGDMPGSRFIPRDSLKTNRTALIEATRDITETSKSVILFFAADVAASDTKGPVAPNSVQPQWRESAAFALLSLGWDFALPQEEMLLRQTELTEEVMPRLRGVLPADAGTYINEAEVGIADWKTDFFGANLKKLEEVKKTFDPDGLFYVEYGVGSDAWERVTDGRLCRV